MEKRFVVILAMFLILGILPSVAHSAVLYNQTDYFNINATHDAYVQQAFPTTVANNLFLVSAANDSQEVVSVISWLLPINNLSNVNNATLGIRVEIGANTTASRRIYALLNHTWNQQTVTWNNLGFTPLYAGNSKLGSSYNSFAVNTATTCSGGGACRVTIPSNVTQQWQETNSNRVDLAITYDLGVSHERIDFNSREGFVSLVNVSLNITANDLRIAMFQPINNQTIFMGTNPSNATDKIINFYYQTNSPSAGYVNLYVDNILKTSFDVGSGELNNTFRYSFFENGALTAGQHNWTLRLFHANTTVQTELTTNFFLVDGANSLYLTSPINNASVAPNLDNTMNFIFKFSPFNTTTLALFYIDGTLMQRIDNLLVTTTQNITKTVVYNFTTNGSLQNGQHNWRIQLGSMNFDNSFQTIGDQTAQFYVVNSSGGTGGTGSHINLVQPTNNQNVFPNTLDNSITFCFSNTNVTFNYTLQHFIDSVQTGNSQVIGTNPLSGVRQPTNFTSACFKYNLTSPFGGNTLQPGTHGWTMRITNNETGNVDQNTPVQQFNLVSGSTTFTSASLTLVNPTQNSVQSPQTDSAGNQFIDFIWNEDVQGSGTLFERWSIFNSTGAELILGGVHHNVPYTRNGNCNDGTLSGISTNGGCFRYNYTSFPPLPNGQYLWQVQLIDSNAGLIVLNDSRQFQLIGSNLGQGGGGTGGIGGGNGTGGVTQNGSLSSTLGGFINQGLGLPDNSKAGIYMIAIVLSLIGAIGTVASMSSLAPGQNAIAMGGGALLILLNFFVLIGWLPFLLIIIEIIAVAIYITSQMRASFFGGAKQ